MSAPTVRGKHDRLHDQGFKWTEYCIYQKTKASCIEVIKILILQIEEKRVTRSGVEGKSDPEIPKEVQSAGVPANIFDINL